MIRELLTRWLKQPSVSGAIVDDSGATVGVIAPTSSPNRLDELCKKYNAYYTRRRDEGVVILKLHLSDGTVLASQSTDTQKAISLLIIQAEKWELLKS